MSECQITCNVTWPKLQTTLKRWKERTPLVHKLNKQKGPEQLLNFTVSFSDWLMCSNEVMFFRKAKFHIMSAYKSYTHANCFHYMMSDYIWLKLQLNLKKQTNTECSSPSPVTCALRKVYVISRIFTRDKWINAIFTAVICNIGERLSSTNELICFPLKSH